MGNEWFGIKYLSNPKMVVVLIIIIIIVVLLVVHLLLPTCPQTPYKGGPFIFDNDKLVLMPVWKMKPKHTLVIDGCQNRNYERTVHFFTSENLQRGERYSFCVP